MTNYEPMRMLEIPPKIIVITCDFSFIEKQYTTVSAFACVQGLRLYFVSLESHILTLLFVCSTTPVLIYIFQAGETEAMELDSAEQEAPSTIVPGSHTKPSIKLTLSSSAKK